ncbi:MAG: NAD(P)H-binding protein [Myxococcota bacterium]
MKLVVLGASGGIGRHLVADAVSRGHAVTAVVRPETPFDAPVGQGSVTVIRDDVLRPGAIAGAVAGADAVLSSLGVKRRTPANPWSTLVSPPDFASSTARSIVAAMREARIRRVIAVSAAGVAESGPRMNAVMRALVARSNIGVAYRDLAVMEQVYADSGLDACCVRPVTLTSGARSPSGSGRVRAVDRFGATMSIARADVAAWMLDHLADPELPRTIQLAG